METTISYGKSDERRIRWTIKSVRKKQKWKEGDSKMKNDYDKYAKERQERLLNGMMPSHRFVEKPMMKSMMPNLKNKKILMLGCGTGEECNLLEMFVADRKNLVGMCMVNRNRVWYNQHNAYPHRPAAASGGPLLQEVHPHEKKISRTPKMQSTPAPMSFAGKFLCPRPSLLACSMCSPCLWAT